MNLLRQAAGALAAFTQSAAGVRLNFPGCGEIPAVVGKSVFNLENSDGLFERTESRDYIVEVKHLKAKLPVAGMQLTDDSGCGVYEIMPLGDEPAWRFCDHQQTLIRIHTKKVGP